MKNTLATSLIISTYTQFLNFTFLKKTQQPTACSNYSFLCNSYSNAQVVNSFLWKRLRKLLWRREVYNRKKISSKPKTCKTSFVLKSHPKIKVYIFFISHTADLDKNVSNDTHTQIWQSLRLCLHVKAEGECYTSHALFKRISAVHYAGFAKFRYLQTSNIPELAMKTKNEMFSLDF